MNPLEAINQTMHSMLCDLQSIRATTDKAAQATDLADLHCIADRTDNTVNLFLQRLNRIEVMLAEVLTRLPDPKPKG